MIFEDLVAEPGRDFRVHRMINYLHRQRRLTHAMLREILTSKRST